MIVEKICVRNWRHLREDHEFDLDNGVNLLVGSNEAGKSTLFEVLQRTLFDRHSSRAQEIKDMQPIQSSLCPEATVILRSNGQRYRVRKRFLDGASSEFSVEREGQWEREHEGGRADEEARQLVEGDVPGRGASKVKHRGIAQALWYLQREDGLPDNEWNQAVQQGLEGLVEVVTSSPRERRILERIEDAYRDNWTKMRGNLSSNSEVSQLEEEVDELEEELNEKKARLEKAERRRGELDDLFSRRARKEEVLDEARNRANTLQEQVDEGDELQKEKKEAERQVEKARREYEDTKEDLNQLIELEETIDQFESDLEDALGEEAEFRQRAEVAKRNENEARTRRRDELEPEHKELRAELEGLRALQDLHRLEDERNELEDALTELRERRDALRELKAPSEDEMETYRERRQKLAVAEGKVESSGIHVSFDLEPDISIEADPSADSVSEGDEYLVTQPTEFALGKVGSVSVRGGGADLRKLQEEIEELREKISATERRFAVSDQDELNERFERRQDLEARIADLEERLEEFTEEEEDPSEALRNREERLDEKRSQADQLPDDLRELGAETLDDEIDGRQERIGELDEEIESIQEEEEEAAKEREKLQERAQQATGEVSSLNGKIASKREQKSEILEQYGTRDQLKKVHDEQQDELEAREVQLRELEEEYENEVGHASEELERAEKEVETLKEQLHDLKEKIAELRGGIHTIADDEVYEEVGDLEGRLEAKRRRLDVVRTRAEGTKLLKELLDTLQQERTEQLAGPVSERVNRWIEVLTNGRYDRILLDESMRPDKVRSTRYQDQLDLEQLSFGTREQVIVLFRLAVGMVLGEEERRLVILDDRLVNSDPVRTRRFCEILEDASESCQILLATCDDSRYGSLDAEDVRIPQDGRATT